jgi:hypothetical protein
MYHSLKLVPLGMLDMICIETNLSINTQSEMLEGMSNPHSEDFFTTIYSMGHHNKNQECY